MWKVLVFLLLFLSCGEKGEIREKVKPGADSVEVVSTDNGRKMWIMKAKKVVERGDTLVGFGVSITFFSGDKPSSQLWADSGKYDQVSGNVSAYGEVYVISSDSTELWTGSLHWDKKRRIIWTDDPVKIRQRDRILYGRGLETDEEISYIKFKSPVRGEGERLE
ncbi:MAG: LPS export ABC transporter periplasmic protein LptC [Candidatus Caldipriscus sp.]|jgi:Protein of unknown function (DUF1239).